MRPSSFRARFSALFGLGIALHPLSSANAVPKKQFSDWCTNIVQLEPGQRHTVTTLLKIAKTKDCSEAEQILGSNPELNLQSQGITDLSPLKSLPHLSNLNLMDNQIKDLSPLSHLPNLSFLLAGRNQIKDVSPLAKLPNLSYVVLDLNQIQDVSMLTPLQKLTSLNLLSNPIQKKLCPVTPSSVCLFSDEAQDQFATAEQQYQQGNLRLALQSFQVLQTTYKQNSDRHKLGDTLNRLGDIHQQMGNYPKALATYEQAFQLRQKITDESGIVVSLTSLASVYERLALYPKAQDLLQQASVSLRNQNPFRLDGGGVYEHAKEEALLYGWQARLFIRQGQQAKALKALDKAQGLFDNIPPAFPNKRFHERLILETRGAALLGLGQPEAAATILESALNVATDIEDQAGMASTLNLLGKAYRHQGNAKQALKAFRQALTINQTIENQPGVGLTHHNIGETWLQTKDYSKASNALAKAVAIWESLRPGLTDANKVSLFETQVITYSYLQTALIALEKPDQALEVAERGRARAFVELLSSRIGADSSSQFQQPSPPTIDQIRNIARSQKATLVEYSLLPEQLLIWVITPDGLVSLRQVDLKALSEQSQQSLPQMVAEARQAMEMGTGTDMMSLSLDGLPVAQSPDHLSQLHQVLINPIADLLPKNADERVIFIPHRELFMVPFPALEGEDGPLIARHTMLTAPSIQLLHYTEQRRKQLLQSPQKALVVGNPDMPHLSPGIDLPAEPLLPLPGAEQEAVEIASLLDTSPLTGAEATEALVTKRMSKAPVIHLATHGLLEELKHLGFSIPGAIALTPSTQQNDGLLTTSEILNLDLQAELVVLSACNTGVGTITGDGVIGLSRALMASGAPSLIVSLWAVPDAPTANLMTEFYTHWQQNPDKAQALRHAMLKTREQHPDPRDWAAFSLMGQAE